MKDTKLLIQLIFVLFLLGACRPAVADTAYFVHVWEDSNGNGTEDPGEKPMPDVSIQFFSPGNGLLWQLSSTDVNGEVYAFSPGGKCGDYQISLSVPSGYWPTTPIVNQDDSCEASFGLKLNPEN